MCVPPPVADHKMKLNRCRFEEIDIGNQYPNVTVSFSVPTLQISEIFAYESHRLAELLPLSTVQLPYAVPHSPGPCHPLPVDLNALITSGSSLKETCCRGFSTLGRPLAHLMLSIKSGEDFGGLTAILPEGRLRHEQLIHHL